MVNHRARRGEYRVLTPALLWARPPRPLHNGTASGATPSDQRSIGFGPVHVEGVCQKCPFFVILFHLENGDAHV